VLPYVLLMFGEVLVSETALEFASTNVALEVPT
jgi:hypothetical protein